MLITDNGKWDMEVLRSLFWEKDIEYISKILICGTKRYDRWIWHYTPNGIVSTRSAYKVCANKMREVECSTTPNDVVWWNRLWKLKIPNKICLFMWRVFFEIVPTNSALNKRHIPTLP